MRVGSSSPALGPQGKWASAGPIYCPKTCCKAHHGNLRRVRLGHYLPKRQMPPATQPKPNLKYQTQATELRFTLASHFPLQPPLRGTGFIQPSLSFNSGGPEPRATNKIMAPANDLPCEQTHQQPHRQTHQQCSRARYQVMGPAHAPCLLSASPATSSRSLPRYGRCLPSPAAPGRRPCDAMRGLSRRPGGWQGTMPHLAMAYLAMACPCSSGVLRIPSLLHGTATATGRICALSCQPCPGIQASAPVNPHWMCTPALGLDAAFLDYKFACAYWGLPVLIMQPC